MTRELIKKTVMTILIIYFNWYCEQFMELFDWSMKGQKIY